jgi:predicted NUDIX family phosphoesterase
VLIHEKKVFHFQRAERDPKYQLYGKSSIWQGTHVTQRPEASPADQIQQALVEKIRDKLFLSRQFDTRYAGYAWDRDDPRSRHHFGLIYMIRIDSEDVAADLRKKEFRSGRGYGLSGKFLEPEALTAQAPDSGLESWSRAVLAGLKEGFDDGA